VLFLEILPKFPTLNVHHNMKRYLLLLSSLLVLAACQEKPQAPKNLGTTDSTSQKAGTENGVLANAPTGDGPDAVIVGTGVRSRADNSTSAEIIRPFQQGELVKIITKSEEPEQIGRIVTDCDRLGFHWYKVRDHAGQESWIYGKYIFRFQEMRSEKGRVQGGQTLSVNGQDYTFQIAVDVAYGPSDDDGLTGCDNMFIPFLYQKGNPAALLFHLDTKKIVSDDLTWKAKKFDTGLLLLLAGSEGGSDDLESVEVRAKEPVLELEITHYYQDGSSTGHLLARVAKDRIDVVGYENDGPSL
jgi:hypothetical protein